MKHKTPAFWLILSLTLLVALGCSVFTREPTPLMPESDPLATAVAGTLASAAQTAEVQAPESTDQEPTQSLVLPPTEVASPIPLVQPVPVLLSVAYLDAARNVWVWKEGEFPRQLTATGDASSVRVSADGTWVAFTRSADQQHESLWVIRADGSGERVVMSEAGFNTIPRITDAIATRPFDFQWVPNSSQLAFNTYPIFDGPGLILNDDLWVVSAESGAPEQLLQAGSGGMFYFSPNGAQIALVKPSSISIINVAGTNRRESVLTHPPVSTYSEYHFYAVPQWSPDSHFLRVFIPAANSLEQMDAPGAVWHIPSDGTAAYMVAQMVTAPLMHASLSPDLNQAAYVKSVGDLAGNRRELHLSSIDSAADTLYLEETLLIFSGWAANSQHFAFTAGEGSQLYLGKAGEAPQPAVDAGEVYLFQWVDADRFLFTVKSGANFELRLGGIGQPSQIITASEVWPSFDYTR